MTPTAPFDPAAHGWTPVQDAGLADHLGPFWQREQDGVLSMGVQADPRHVNRNGAVHGGLVLALCDHTLGHASRLATGDQPQATVQLDVQFVAGVRVGDFLAARGIVARLTRSLVFMRGEVTVGDRLVATAGGVWKRLGT